MARKLQQEEDKLGRMFAHAGPTAAGAASGKKRGPAGKAGGGGGRQATLTSAFGKRPRQ